MCRRCVVVVLLLGVLIGAPGRADLSDPTRPARPGHRPSVTTRTAASEFILSSVMLSGKRRVAVINGRSVQPGDRIRGARVVEINLSGVRLRRADGDVLLTLTETGFKRPSRERGNR